MKVIDYCVCCGSKNVEFTPGAIAPFIADRIWGWVPQAHKSSEGYEFVAFPLCKTVRCQDCDYVGCDIRFDDEEMGKLYTNYRDEQYVALREKYEPAYRKLNNELENEQVGYFAEMEAFILDDMSVKPARVLDWGGNNGINTPFTDAETVHIYEIGGKAPLYGKLVNEPEPPYDLIVLSNTLEHVPYPRNMLRQIKGSMSKDTLLYIEIPIEELWMAMWHEHINKFSPKSAERLLHVCGLKMLRMKLCPPPKHGYSNLAMINCRRADED